MSTAHSRLTALLCLALALGACAADSLTPSGAPASPSASSAGTAPSHPAPSVSTGPRASPAPGGTTYIVRAGDTLSSIARAWGTTIAQLQTWNAGRYPSLATDPNRLVTGWILIVAGDPLATPQATPAGTAAPTPSATPAPPAGTGCHAGKRVAAGSLQTFYRIPSSGHAVGLTFDMGGRLEPGLEIMRFLVEHGVCATVFPTGVMADTPQGREVMAVVRAHPEIFEIGNHTMHHCDLVRGGGGSPSTAPCDGVTPTADFIRRELTDAAAILRRQTGQDPVPYWRPPYGAVNDAVRAAAASVGYTKTFMWDIDTVDWKPISDGGPTAQQIATKVITQAGDGSVVLMHLGGYETLDALRIMVPGLRDRGLLLTSLSDMLN
jgi:peptidoglycan/xylan/chitin deacetylase (PgdA/CDA1 family)